MTLRIIQGKSSYLFDLLLHRMSACLDFTSCCNKRYRNKRDASVLTYTASLVHSEPNSALSETRDSWRARLTPEVSCAAKK